MGVLAVVGFDEIEERVYGDLVRRPSGSPAELAASTGLSRRRVTDSLHRLESRGLVVTLAGTEIRYAVAPPEPALDALIHERQQELARVRAHGELLAKQVRQVTEELRPQDLVAVVVGAEAVHAHYAQLQRHAQREILTFDRPPYPHTGGGLDANPLQVERIAAGVVYRTVYDRNLLDQPQLLARVQSDLAGGENGRVLADVPFKLTIADRSAALLPLLDPGESNDMAALLIRTSVLLESLAALFEALWQRAVPLRLGGDGVQINDVDPELRVIVELMATGMTDESIAGYLGVSMRTVGRKIAAALQALGVETRFQAGRRAQMLGWLPDQ